MHDAGIHQDAVGWDGKMRYLELVGAFSNISVSYPRRRRPRPSPFLADKAIMRLYLLISMQYAVLPQRANILIRGNMEQMRLIESFCKMYLLCLYSLELAIHAA